MKHTIEPRPPGAALSGRVAVALALAALALSAFPPVAFAQTSTNYKLVEHSINAAGHPAQGTILVSTGGAVGFRITLDAAGEAVVGPTMTNLGGTFRMDGGFLLAYPPPGEVANLQLSADEVTLSWNSEKSFGDYNLYRDLLSSLSGVGYGLCEQSAITATSTTDAGVPPTGDGYFYLVTARNRLREEGTKGFDSAGAERPNPSPCP